MIKEPFESAISGIKLTVATGPILRRSIELTLTTILNAGIAADLDHRETLVSLEAHSLDSARCSLDAWRNLAIRVDDLTFPAAGKGAVFATGKGDEDPPTAKLTFVIPFNTERIASLAQMLGDSVKVAVRNAQKEMV